MLKKSNCKLILIFICIMLIAMLSACSGDEESNSSQGNTNGSSESSANDGDNSDEDSDDNASRMDEIAFMVGEQEVRLGEVMLYMQSDIEKIEALYGTEIWNLELDSTGITVGETYKDELMNQIAYVKIVCAQAAGLDIALSEDELIDINLATEDFMSSLTEEQIAQYGITEERVYNIYCDNMLANKVYEILTLNIDTAVTEEEVRNMVLQYISISKFYRDANGKQLEYTEEELASIKSKAQAFLDEVKTRGVSSLTELEQDEYQITELTAGRSEIVEELSSELAGLAFGLREGEFSEIYETEHGFYILFCAAESDEEATQRATIEILEERQKTLFEELYNEWELNTRIRVNWDIWDSLDWF